MSQMPDQISHGTIVSKSGPVRVPGLSLIRTVPPPGQSSQMEDHPHQPSSQPIDEFMHDYRSEDSDHLDGSEEEPVESHQANGLSSNYLLSILLKYP